MNLALLQEALSGEGTRATFQLLDLPELWIVVLLVIPGSFVLAWISYLGQGVELRRRIVLAGLRAFAFLLLFAILFRPVFVERREEVRPAEVLVLVDDSASMLRQDAYVGQERRRDALEELLGRAPEGARRIDLTRAALDKVVLAQARERGYLAKTYRFGETLEPLADSSALSGRSNATALGAALSQALATHRGRHVTDIIVLSDGRNNSGLPPEDVARNAASMGIPVHTIVVGDTRPEKNALVEIAEAPPSALEGDEIEVSVRLVGRGTPAGARTAVVLEEIDGEGRALPISEESAELSAAGARVVLIAPPVPMEAGRSERRLRVRVPVQPEETLTDDNQVDFTVRITPEKLRVLYVDGYPRWEYRYLKNLLLRSDQNIQAQCFLLSATPDFVQESTKGVPALERVPTDRRALLENYDVVILGDVNPFRISADPRACDEFLSALQEFVERGGGLISQAGEMDNPRSFLGTPVEELLPIVIDPTGLALGDASGEEFHGELEAPKAPHEIVRLTSDVEENRALWEGQGGLRGFTWFYPALRAKPGAESLLRHPQAQNAAGKHPLLVAGYFPAGRTLYIGIDSTWMWRYRFGDRFHERFWRNALRWVALGRLKSGDRRVQLDALRSRYDLDERVVLEARVLDEDYRPGTATEVEARLEDPEGKVTPLRLELVPERPGQYRVSLEPERAGVYRAWIESEAGANGTQRSASTEFEVVLPSRENNEPAPNPELMARLAQGSGGIAMELSDLRALEDALPGGEERREPLSSELDDIWDSFSTLALALAFLCAEWILRKKWELV
ncbi:MAG: hypothetical protein RL277_1052 [Planctomycetota bacterium]|jgi:uncharacterized membrane protein